MVQSDKGETVDQEKEVHENDNENQETVSSVSQTEPAFAQFSTQV
jgi:hypothetical protein